MAPLNFCRHRQPPVIASAAKRSSLYLWRPLDCFVTSFLAKTVKIQYGSVKPLCFQVAGGENQ